MSNEQIDRVITGFRPTSDLTLGNYLGAVKPSIEIQDDPTKELYVFVADLHGLTDTDPREIEPYRFSVVRDLIAMGIHPEKSTMYMQSDIESPIAQIANRLAPYISVSELARTPNLKEKMQDAVKKGDAESDEALKANFALLGYPVLMAADIFAQQSELVAVGEDQVPHLELARSIARRFNNKLENEVLVEPKLLAFESLRILSLDGKGKMSKTNPNQAILLTDDPEMAAKKIKGAMTAGAGESNEVLDSHFIVAESTANTEEQKTRLNEIKVAHFAGKAVMKEFKELWSEITIEMLESFQKSKAAISDDEVKGSLLYSGDKAERNALNTLSRMKKAMGF